MALPAEIPDWGCKPIHWSVQQWHIVGERYNANSDLASLADQLVREVRVRWQGHDADQDEWNPARAMFPMEPQTEANLAQWEKRVADAHCPINSVMEIGPAEGTELTAAEAHFVLHDEEEMGLPSSGVPALQGAAAAGLVGRVAALQEVGSPGELYAGLRCGKDIYALVPASVLTPTDPGRVHRRAAPVFHEPENSEERGRQFRLQGIRPYKALAAVREWRIQALEREKAQTGRCEAEGGKAAGYLHKVLQERQALRERYREQAREERAAAGGAAGAQGGRKGAEGRAAPAAAAAAAAGQGAGEVPAAPAAAAAASGAAAGGGRDAAAETKVRKPARSTGPAPGAKRARAGSKPRPPPAAAEPPKGAEGSAGTPGAAKAGRAPAREQAEGAAGCAERAAGWG
eukprot:TRINITY_DN9597_c0_g2_i3.p3 TRINITY_DN9597_c0_g2~~TRINITY_DN9597_c0_g2_i3.p3  ORF type:complete len:433 (+),score=77.43 TRINITY_DN9597_c0_g2_i3:94-1299(+)